MLVFEDFTPGRSFALGPKTVTAEEIVDFAKEYDPQPMHLDEVAGKASILGGLAASGWHTCSLFMRMATDSFLLGSSCVGLSGIHGAEWRKPVLAGDRLSGSSTVIGTGKAFPDPGFGSVAFRHEIYNERDELVCLIQNAFVFDIRMTAGR